MAKRPITAGAAENAPPHGTFKVAQMGAAPVPGPQAIKLAKHPHGKSCEAIPTTMTQKSGQKDCHWRRSSNAPICPTCTISRKFPSFRASGHRIHQMPSWQALGGHSSHHGPKKWPKGPSLQEQLKRTPTANFQSCSDGCSPSARASGH